MPKISFVTGGNQGLGLALVRGLCQRAEPGDMVYLTARDPDRGEAAVQALRAEGLDPTFHPLDVADESSVAAFAAHVRDTHGGADVVLSNAAARIAKDRTQADQVRHFVDTNNAGTRRVLDAFVSLLRDGARLVVVASSFGRLRQLPPALHDRFDTNRMSLDDLDRVMTDYADAAAGGRAAVEGWPDWINVPSKIGQVAAVRIVARERAAEFRRRGVLMNAACPGLVDTAASRPWFDDMSEAAPPDEAAQDLLWLATLTPGTTEPYGQLVQHRRVLSFQ